jgi:hypothetical protein
MTCCSWFHAPFRADEWLLYDCRSSRLEHSRGFNTGRLYNRDGVLVVSTAQEGLIRFHDAPPKPLGPAAQVEPKRRTPDGSTAAVAVSPVILTEFDEGVDVVTAETKRKITALVSKL